MELKTEWAKRNSNEIRMLKDMSLKATLFHFTVRSGQRTDKAHIAEQKNTKQVSKQPNSLMHATGLEDAY